MMRRKLSDSCLLHTENTIPVTSKDTGCEKPPSRKLAQEGRLWVCPSGSTAKLTARTREPSSSRTLPRWASLPRLGPPQSSDRADDVCGKDGKDGKNGRKRVCVCVCARVCVLACVSVCGGGWVGWGGLGGRGSGCAVFVFVSVCTVRSGR